MASPCQASVGCHFASRDVSGNILLPEWILSLNLSNYLFRTMLHKTVSDYLGQQKQDRISGLPLWCTWSVVLWRRMAACIKMPACIVFYSERLFVLRLDNLVCREGEESEGVEYREGPQVLLTAVLSVSPSCIRHVLTGPNNAYVEMHVSDPDGMQMINFFLPNVLEFLEKLKCHLGVYSKEKYSRGEFEEASCNALITHSSSGVRLLRRVGQVMCCELVHQVKLEDQVKQRHPQNVVSLVLVTPELVLLLEETLSYPALGSPLPFKVSVVFDVCSDVHSIQMKDSGSGSHNCCCHGQQVRTELKEKCCLLHDLYTSGFWLLVDCEGSRSIKVRFISREARSRFLEAFLAARNHI